MNGLQWKIPFKWMFWGGTLISGNLHVGGGGSAAPRPPWRVVRLLVLPDADWINHKKPLMREWSTWQLTPLRKLYGYISWKDTAYTAHEPFWTCIRILTSLGTHCIHSNLSHHQSGHLWRLIERSLSAKNGKDLQWRRHCAVDVSQRSCLGISWFHMIHYEKTRTDWSVDSVTDSISLRLKNLSEKRAATGDESPECSMQILI